MIAEGDTVICRLQDEKSSMLLKVSGEQKILKTYVSMKNLVGASYGSVFNIVGKELEPASSEYAGAASAAAAAASAATAAGSSAHAAATGAASTDALLAVEIGADKDNRNFNDTNTSQKLKDADIKRLRSEGASGEDIIRTLIANSETWNTKTEFSQEKWLKKKQRKYMRKMRVVKCTPATVCEVYHLKSRDKICHLRPDSLAQMLSQSGVFPGCRVLVVDSVIGLAVGSVAYRLRGEGQILAVFNGQQPHFALVSALNLADAHTDNIVPVPSNELAPAARDVLRGGFANEGEPEPEPVPVSVGAQGETESQPANQPPSAEAEAAVTDAMQLDPPAPSSPQAQAEAQAQAQAQAEARPAKDPRVFKSYNRSGRHPLELQRSRLALRQGLDSLIICSRFDPLPILRQALPLLLPSAPFVVYYEFLEPLVECYRYLQDEQLAVRLTLSDTWMREFQTLPNRVHPQMFMSTSSGYLLTGVYVGVVPLQQSESEAGGGAK